MGKKITIILMCVLMSLSASAQWSNFLNKVKTAVDTANATAEQKQASATLSEQLKSVYNSFIESYTYDDISKAVEKTKSLDVSGCPVAVQEKYKVMIEKLDSFNTSFKKYLDDSKISSDKSIKEIITTIMTSKAENNSNTATADVSDKSQSFVKSLNELMTSAAAVNLLSK